MPVFERLGAVEPAVGVVTPASAHLFLFCLGQFIAGGTLHVGDPHLVNLEFILFRP